MSRSGRRARLRRFCAGLIAGGFLVATAAWSVLAVAYGMRGPGWIAHGLAGLVACLAIANALLLRRRFALLGGAALFAVVLAWWLRLSPSDNRDWQPEYAVAASAEIDGNRVRLRNVRNATWRKDGAFVPAYYDAEYALDRLNEVDLISSYWAGDAVAHVFVSFGFDDGRHVAISVETRRERGEEYSALAGFFRRYELIYVVADERDLIGVRTDIRRERVYLYRLNATPAEKRGLFLSYVSRIAELHATPQFYNTLTDNCTTNVVQRANAAAGGLPASWMLLVSGYADQYAYRIERLDQTVGFAELKQRSLIRRAEDARIGEDFSALIRTPPG